MFLGCKKEKSLNSVSTLYINNCGEIKQIICSRGCYQYLLKTNKALYMPDSIPESVKTNKCKVIFSGYLKHDSSYIFKPALNDMAIPDFKVRNIKLSKIAIR